MVETDIQIVTEVIACADHSSEMMVSFDKEEEEEEETTNTQYEDMIEDFGLTLI